MRVREVRESGATRERPPVSSDGVMSASGVPAGASIKWPTRPAMRAQTYEARCYEI